MDAIPKGIHDYDQLIIHTNNQLRQYKKKLDEAKTDKERHILQQEAILLLQRRRMYQRQKSALHKVKSMVKRLRERKQDSKTKNHENRK
jgi:hypothetical protein